MDNYYSKELKKMDLTRQLKRQLNDLFFDYDVRFAGKSSDIIDDIVDITFGIIEQLQNEQ